MTRRTPARLYAWEAIARRLGVSVETVANTAAALGVVVKTTDATGDVTGDVSGSLLGPLQVVGLLGDALDGPIGDKQVWVKDDASDTYRPGYIEDLGTAETDTSLVLAPDGSGGVEFRAETAIPTGTYELAIEGGQDVINPLGSVSGAVAVDPTDGNIVTLTLTGDVTATIAPPSGSGGADLQWWVTQNGVGGHALTIAATAGTVTDDGTLTPDTTAGVTVRYITERIPGTGNDWVRDLVGGSGGSALTVQEEGSPLATAAGTLNFVGRGTTASGTGSTKTITSLLYEPHVSYDGTVVLDGNGDPVMVLVA